MGKIAVRGLLWVRGVCVALVWNKSAARLLCFQAVIGCKEHNHREECWFCHILGVLLWRRKAENSTKGLSPAGFTAWCSPKKSVKEGKVVLELKQVIYNRLPKYRWMLSVGEHSQGSHNSFGFPPASLPAGCKTQRGSSDQISEEALVPIHWASSQEDHCKLHLCVYLTYLIKSTRSCKAFISEVISDCMGSGGICSWA